jgi:hypothetical protein
MDDTQTHGRLVALAEEYVGYVEAMRTGQFADDEEWRRLSSERTLVHDELLQMTGMTRKDDMYVFCRNLLADRRSAEGR